MWRISIRRVTSGGSAGVNLIASAGEADTVALGGTLSAAGGIGGGAGTVDGTAANFGDTSPAPSAHSLSATSTLTGTADTYV